MQTDDAPKVVLNRPNSYPGFSDIAAPLSRFYLSPREKLAPTVKSRQAEAGTLSTTATVRDGGGKADGLGLTMFDRVLRDLGHQVCRMLDVQYRMNRDICDWASAEVRCWSTHTSSVGLGRVDVGGGLQLDPLLLS